MKTYINPAKEELEDLLSRPTIKLKSLKKVIKPILKSVKRRGDNALKRFALEYDHAEIKDVLVTKEEIKAAEKSISVDLKEAIHQAVKNIENFHSQQVQKELVVETMLGVTCMRRSVAIEKVGLYVPGGTAPLFSTVLMLGIPAKIAGCKEVVLCTPPNKKGEIYPAILYAAKLVGIHKVVKAGGAQAIAAMAFGTESVPRVSKIFGPGNQYVTAAKQYVSQKGIAIDMPAGPSEVAIYADETAVPDFVAADLLSQAEHGVDSQVLLVANSVEVKNSCMEALESQLQKLPRKRIAEQSIAKSVAIVVEKEQDAIDILNEYAAEHLILSVKNPEAIADKIINAGSVFLGNFAPESVGDYASGTNHTLPTNRAALAYSGVSVDSFVKKITYQKLTEKGIKNIGPTVEVMAAEEQLDGHKNAVTLRLNYLKDK